MAVRKIRYIFMLLCMLAALLCCAAQAESRIELPWELSSVGEQAFYRSSAISEVVLPDNIKRIESKAFADSTLSIINLPASLEYIAPDAFDGCENLLAECTEGSYAYTYCSQQKIQTAPPALVVRVLLHEDPQGYGKDVREALDAALQTAFAGLENRVRIHCDSTANSGWQEIWCKDALIKGADLVLMDLVDVADAQDFAQGLSDAGVPTLFLNAEPPADVVTEHQFIYVGSGAGRFADVDELAETCAAIAANYLSTGSWLEGLEYASEDGWSVRLEPRNRLAGVKIGIDPGHQRKGNSEKEYVAPNSTEKKAKVSSGTSGVSTGTAEYVRNLEISLQLRDALRALGAEVYMTREIHDVNISNMERALMMNNLGVDLVLRLHCNGSTNQSSNGIGLYITNSAAITAESQRAAEALLPAMVAATGARSCGIFKRDSYTGLNWSTVPCILVEMGYMTNPAEDLRLADPAYQQKLVNGMVAGICSYMGR